MFLTCNSSKTFAIVLVALCAIVIGCEPSNIGKTTLQPSLMVSESKTSETQKSDESGTVACSLAEVIQRAEKALTKLRAEVRDYTATMTKRERIGGSLGDVQSMSMKIICRQYDSQKQPPEVIKPLHAYLRFLAPKKMVGREVIWVEGKDDNQLIAHEAGVFNVMSVRLDPKGLLAMMGNRYPITEIGIEKLLMKLIERGKKDLGVLDTQVSVLRNELFDGIPCDRIRIVHPNKKPEIDFHIAEIWIDPTTERPLYYASFSWPTKAGQSPQLDEEYGYRDLKVNVGLAENDFDPKNPDYQFP